MVASFVSQMRALLWRNYLLKLHGDWIEEVLSPLSYIIFLIILRLLIELKIKPSTIFPVVPLANFSIPDKLLMAVSPPGLNVENVMRKISGQLNVRYLIFNSSSEAEEIYNTNPYLVWAGIIFGFTPEGPTSDIMQYAIRMPPHSLPSYFHRLKEQVCHIDNDTVVGTVDFPVNCYLKSGFAYLQSVIDQSLMQINNITIPNVEVSIQMMKREFTPDFHSGHLLISFNLAMAYSPLINYITVYLVTEKEKKIREGMFMMGLRNSVLWLSWLVVYCVINIMMSALVLILAQLASFFPNSNMLLVFAVLMLYGMSIMALAFLITPFFRRVQIASPFSTVFVIFISFGYIFLSVRSTKAAMGYNYKISHSQQWAVCLLSPLAFAMAIEQILFLDTYHGGMSLVDTIHVGDFPLYASMIMLSVDTVLYFLLAIYLDHVIPGEFGVRYKPWYFLMKSYWFPHLSGSGKRMHLMTNQSLETDKDLSFSHNVESVSASTQRQNAVRIIKLTKAFNKKRNTPYAVKDFSLDIYEGHITALLGHNGAGKTTIINILTGLIPPTSGTAIIRGLDVTSSCDMEEIRSMCGICPQHDILYNDLTCREHLQVFAGIKGVPANKTLSEVDRLLDSLGLAEKGNKFASELSGGQKRKLSVAIALIGDPKIIFLDEPTAGMDPYSRRQLWSFLKSHKKGRIVLLTTHFMDEADILADRKAFIRQGQLQCCGSSLFLKNKYGIGYYLSMVVEPTCSFESVTKLIQSYISGAKFQRSHGKELSYIIPGTEVDKFASVNLNGYFQTYES